jgi:hypothetical protein
MLKQAISKGISEGLEKNTSGLVKTVVDEFLVITAHNLREKGQLPIELSQALKDWLKKNNWEIAVKKDK